jgi:hypothetical protein
VLGSGEPHLHDFPNIPDQPNHFINPNRSPGAIWAGTGLPGPLYGGPSVPGILGKQRCPEAVVVLLNPLCNKAVDVSHAGGFVGENHVVLNFHKIPPRNFGFHCTNCNKIIKWKKNINPHFCDKNCGSRWEISLEKAEQADGKNQGALVRKEFCCLTKQLAHKFCPRTIKRKVSSNKKFSVCTFHNMRHDIDHLYIHYLMNKKYRDERGYQIMRAIREEPWIRLIYATGNKGGNYPALQRLLRKLDKSKLIKHRIGVIDPSPQHTRDYYGNYKSYFPDEEKSSRIYQDLRWLLLNGGSLNGKIRREFSRKYHESAGIIQFCYDWAKQDLERYSPQELRILRDLEPGERARRVKKKISKTSNK